jgi:ubiquinone/menaquinone biosynthesis C-methylase UbiE
MTKEAEFERIQREYFAEPEIEHYRWTTSDPGFAETEDELLAPIRNQLEGPCLEIGCGEGNNLLRLAGVAPCFGIDLFRRKLQFAARELPAAQFAVSRAESLPFADARFRTVLIRDVLHHIKNPRTVLQEAVRILAPDGRLWLLEPNSRNPIVRLQIGLVPAEQGARKFNRDYVASLLEGLPLAKIQIGAEQPFPLRRLILHYEFGFPAIGRWRPARAFLRALEKLTGGLIPENNWCYISVTARKV